LGQLHFFRFPLDENPKKAYTPINMQKHAFQIWNGEEDKILKEISHSPIGATVNKRGSETVKAIVHEQLETI